MLVLTLLLGLAIGAVLGGLGGGGAILTVPALVYILGETGQNATTSSLVIVGLTALVGVASYISSRRVSWATGIGFGIAGIPAAWAGTYLNHRVDQHILLLGFAALMLVAAVAMVLDRAGRNPREPQATSVSAASRAGRRPSLRHPGDTLIAEVPQQQAPQHTRPALRWIVIAGLVVGFLTGFFGVGGGFVIVPALVLALRLPMQQAVGTSLLIVAANSATSLLSRAGTAHFDWSVIVPFTVAAMIATLAGKRVADRLPARRLKVAFAGLLVLVAGYTGWQNIGVFTSSTTTAGDRAPWGGGL